MIKKQYQLRGITVDQLVEETNAYFSLIANDESLEQTFQQKDINLEMLRTEVRQADGHYPIEVKPTGAYLAPETIEVIVTFGPLITVSAEIIRDLWKYVILPRILDRYGVDTVRDMDDEA